MPLRTSRPLLGAAAALVVLFAATPAFAQDPPCSSLGEAEAKAYVAAATEAVEAYQAEDYGKSVAKNREALAICFENPDVYYNLARAYHKGGDCHMALFTYEEIDLSKMDKKKTKKVEGYMEELTPECGDSVSVLITCATPGVSLEFGDRKAECPWSGRIDTGEQTIVATKADHETYEGTISVSPDNTSIEIPALVDLSQFGTLSVNCAEGVSMFKLSGPEGDEELACPYEGQRAIGSYQLSTDPEGTPVSATVVGMETTNIDALSTAPPSSCACQVRRGNDSAPLGSGLAMLGLAGLGFLAVRRRRRDDA